MRNVKGKVRRLTPLLLCFFFGCRESPEQADACVGASCTSHPADAALPSKIDAGALFQEITLTRDTLDFVIVGDTRPSIVDRTDLYPTVINTIFASVEAESPHPQFAITTGDYMYATPSGSEQQNQMNLYMTARNAFKGVVIPTMGNHEC